MTTGEYVEVFCSECGALTARPAMVDQWDRYECAACYRRRHRGAVRCPHGRSLSSRIDNPCPAGLAGCAFPWLRGDVLRHAFYGWTLTRDGAGSWAISTDADPWSDGDVAEALEDIYRGEFTLGGAS